MARRYVNLGPPCMACPEPEPTSGCDPDGRGRDRVSGGPLTDGQANYQRDKTGRITTRARIDGGFSTESDKAMPLESGLVSRRRLGY